MNHLPFTGTPLYVHDFLGWHTERTQVKFPRSKKRRIRKKFAKDNRNYCVRRWQEPVALKSPIGFIVNEPMMAKLREHKGTNS